MSNRLWDYTALSCLEKCEEEFVQRFLLHREGHTTDLSALFGQAVHAGIGGLYAALVPDDAAHVASQYWVERAKLVIDNLFFVNKKPHLTGDYAGAITQMYAQVHAGRLACVLNEQYLEDPEEGFCGVVDRVRMQGGNLAVRDLKTTGLYISEAWGNQWAQSAQAAGYLDLAERHLKQAPIAEFWADGIHVDKRGFPKAEDIHEFGPFTYPPGLRQELRKVRQQAILRARELEEHPERALKSTGSCFRFNSLCSFFRYCATAPEDRENRYHIALGGGELTTRKWNPANRE